MSEQILHSLKNPGSTKGTSFFIGIAIMILLGVASGYIGVQLLTQKGGSIGALTSLSLPSGVKSEGKKDTAVFPDTTEGTLKSGGIEGEGTHHLVRPGGVSQTVYLTSSVVDLENFMNKKVVVWGKTFSSEKAGWFMDVGYIEVK